MRLSGKQHHSLINNAVSAVQPISFNLLRGECLCSFVAPPDWPGLAAVPFPPLAKPAGSPYGWSERRFTRSGATDEPSSDTIGCS